MHYTVKYYLNRAKMMSNRWGNNFKDEQLINFDQMFEAESFSAAKLINVNNIVDEVKRQNEKITRKLIDRPQILRQLFDICLRPSFCSNTEIKVITNQQTYKAVEILTNLSEEFSQYLLTSHVVSKDEDDIDDVVTEPISDVLVQPNPLFEDFIKILKDERPLDETPLAYLTKIMTSFCYQNPKQIILALNFKDNQQFVFNHFYSRSIYQLFIKLLQISDSSSSFFQQQKLNLLQSCHQSIRGQKNQEFLVQKLQNYQSLLQILLQKIDDRFDKAKYSSMSKKYLADKQSISFLFLKIEEFEGNEQILQKCLKIMNIYLKFSSTHRSINTSKNSDNSNLQSSIYEIRLNAEVISEVKKLAANKKSGILTENITENKILLVTYLKLLKSLLIFDNENIEQLVDEHFINSAMKVMRKFGKSNIVHNVIKQILQYSVTKNYAVIVPLLLDEQKTTFLQMSAVINTKNNEKEQYENQLYHIFATIVRKGEENAEVYEEYMKNFEERLGIIKEKERFYSEMIGGNPRKQSSNWGDSSQQIVFEKILPESSDKKIIEYSSSDATDFIMGSNEHWVDCDDLPLDSDQSRDQPSKNEPVQSTNANAGDGKNEVQILNLDLSIESRESLDEEQKGKWKGEKEANDKKKEANDKKGDLTNDKNKQLQENKSFNKHFEMYLSFQIDEIFAEVQ